MSLGGAGFSLLVLQLFLSASLCAHPLTFNSTITYSANQPSGASGSASNWTGAAFDAGNVGGSGTNAAGGANNGLANDSSTYVANNQPRQGQSITTGSNTNGYDVSSITVRMAGYTNNTAGSTNNTAWDLNFQNGPIVVEIGKVTSATNFATVFKQNYLAGGTNSPGAGTSANGPGTYITFRLPSSVHLEPNTTYAFDLCIGNNGGNYFEWLGTSASPYAGGTAYTRGGTTLAQLAGDRVFMVDMAASVAPYAPFAHPGTLHTATDFARMAGKVAAGAEPWKADYDILAASPWAQTWWPAYDVDYINRGGAAANNYTRSQQDAQAIYELALMWKITGNTAYADHAVAIANVWSGLLGITGDTNASLAAGICGYLFAIGGEILSTYPGWAAADKQSYKDMMMRVFYPANWDFLWRHHNTFSTMGGNTHYRLNWDTCNAASMAAIGILCDNKAVYQQAVDYFKFGAGNGRVERAAWYIHPDGMAQTEESGRDQGHNLGGWYSMALLCQMAWNQGDDLYGYDNSRVLRAFEACAKYNLSNEVPWVYHRNTDLAYTETLSPSGRGLGGYPFFEQVYNHYVNVRGMAAPYCKLAAEAMRPEARPHPEYHPSQVDWFGLGTLVFTRDAIASGAAPSGLTGNWSKDRVTLNWWGSAYATGYNIKRSETSGGPYTNVGTAGTKDLTFADATVTNAKTYYYVVSANTPSGETANSPEWAARRALVTQYTFDNTFNDSAGSRNASAMGGSTGATSFAAGKSGQAASFDGADDYVQLPAASGNYQDITIAAWVYWNGGSTWQRVFDFGSEIEKFMMLTVNAGSNLLRFSMTTSRGTDGTLSLTGPAMPTATWTHVAVTLNGDTATMYVNGKPVASGDAPMVDPLFGQPFCYLGKSMWNSDPLFSGKIDDFRIYNYGLTGKEVYAVAAAGGTNSAPSFTANPMSFPGATEDAAYTGQTLAAYATDINGGTLAYSKVNGPAWLAVASNGALSGTPANADVGTNLFVVRVTDASGATDDANLYITVVNANDAPAWGATVITRSDVTLEQPLVRYTLAGEASDIDAGDTIAYSKASGPAWLSVATDGSLSGTPAASDVGPNAFTVRATDIAGAYADAMLTINVLPHALRAQYLFEDNTDDSANAFDGTANGLPAYGLGRLGRGIVFDGLDDYVSLPAAAADSQDFTAAAWVYWNGGSAWQRIFDFGGDTTHYMFLTPNSGSGLRFAINNGGAEEQVNYASALPSGQWVHLAVTLAGSTATIYLNGAAVATNSAITIHPGDFKPALNYIGKSRFAADPMFAGTVDDFRIYNHAVTPAEIAAMTKLAPSVPLNVAVTPKAGRIDLAWSASQGATTYTVKRSTTSGSGYAAIASGIAAQSYSDTSVANGVTYYYVVTASNGQGESAASGESSAVASDLLVWLKFNETNGTTAYDASGNGWHAALVNSPGWTNGIYAGGSKLTGVSSNYLTLPPGVVSGLTDFTVSGWINLSSFSTWQRAFDFGTGTTNYMFLTTQHTATAPNNAKFRFAIRTPSTGEQQLNSAVSVGTNTWVHYAVTLSNATGKLYINGVPVATNGAMTLKPSSLGNTTQNYLGKSQWSDPYLDGCLDDFRIHTRALSAEEVATAAAPAPPLPTGVSAAPGDSIVRLAWSSADFASGYSIRRATSTGGSYVTLASAVAGTSYADASAVNGTTYFYVVSGSNAQGESANSSEAVATPFATRFCPYVPDTNTLVLLHFSEAAGGTSTTNSGTLGKRAYSVSLAAAVTNPATVTNSIGAAVGYAGFGGAADLNSSGYALGWDANGNGAYNADAGSASLSEDKIPQSKVNIGNGGQSPWTIEAMVNCNLATLNANQEIISTDSSSTNARGFQFRITSAGELELNFINGTSSGTADIKATIPLTGAHAYTTNAWFHAAATYDGTNARLYWTKVDPSPAEANLLTATPVGVGTNAGAISGPLCVGNENRNIAGEYFHGAIDEVRLSSAARGAGDFYWLPAPATPQGLTATAGDGSVSLAWTPSGAAAGYYVKRSITGGGPYVVVATVADAAFVDSDTTNGVAYFYAVSAINGAGQSSSATAAATPLSALQAWRQQHFGSTDNAGRAADSADPDGDGRTNTEEYAAGTNPTDPHSALIISDASWSSGAMTVTFPTIAGKVYRIDYADSVSSGGWSLLQDDIDGTGTAARVLDPNAPSASQRFYRVTVHP